MITYLPVYAVLILFWSPETLFLIPRPLDGALIATT